MTSDSLTRSGCLITMISGPIVLAGLAIAEDRWGSELIYFGAIPLALVTTTFGLLWLLNVQRLAPWFIAALLTFGCWFAPALGLIETSNYPPILLRLIVATSPFWIVAAAIAVDRAARKE